MNLSRYSAARVFMYHKRVEILARHAVSALHRALRHLIKPKVNCSLDRYLCRVFNDILHDGLSNFLHQHRYLMYVYDEILFKPEFSLNARSNLMYSLPSSLLSPLIVFDLKEGLLFRLNLHELLVGTRASVHSILLTLADSMNGARIVLSMRGQRIDRK